MKIIWISILAVLTMAGSSCKDKKDTSGTVKEESVEVAVFQEEYRPQYHFTPAEKWMNDPNGLVYNDGVYHLFYQYYPGDIIWGPMHWGHAVSKDLVFWEHRPIALFPDNNGYIFSGSAVVDKNNTSGLGTDDAPPLVAIFTYHDINKEQAGDSDYQTQGIAYSTDNGEIWVKYPGNPVITNKDGLKDFRDPKVFWNEGTQNWILVLVAGDHAQLYSSANLLEWEFMSEFGRDKGAHGGVWECPDLFPLQVEGSGEEKWVLLISINPGAPNGGSGTQYFIGNFNGTDFTTDQTDTRWLDWGPDNYAGVTYNDVPDGSRIFIGWMSNWAYAMQTPTDTWRSAMTVPRKLSLRNFGDTLSLVNYPLENLATILKPEGAKKIEIPQGGLEVISNPDYNQSEVRFRTASRNFTLTFSNEQDEDLVLTMDGIENDFLINRSASGKTDFQEDFGKQPLRMPIPNLPPGQVEVRLLLDASSVELFINGGQYVMTAQLFPNAPYTDLKIENKGKEPLEFDSFEVSAAESIW